MPAVTGFSNHILIRGAALAAALLCTAGAVAQEQGQQSPEALAEDVVTQPARDAGLVKPKVPPVLQQAVRDPYGLTGLSGCARLGAAVRELNAVLGPDLVPETNPRHGLNIKVSGDTVAGLVVPFRGVLREVSGAAAAQREMNVAISAGFARRGFLHGVYAARGCQPAM